MYERILAPLDFSETDYPGLDQAIRMAGETSMLTLIHVIEKIEHLDEAEDQNFYARLEKLAAKKLGERAEYVKAKGVAVCAELVYGKKVNEILGHAREYETDLIVMSSTRVRPDRPIGGFDSTSHSIAMLSQCPVFLVKC